MQKKIFKHLLLCAILLIAFVSCTNKKTCPICFGRGTMNTEMVRQHVLYVMVKKSLRRDI